MRRIRILALTGIAYNVVEAAVALIAGEIAGSTALLGFGLDSIIEVSSALALTWQFAAADPVRRQSRERRALQVTALSFAALAVYITVGAVHALVAGAHPSVSPVGIALAAASLVVMPGISIAQRRAGRDVGSASAVADSKQTMLCTYLSAVLLLGLLTNAICGAWWADPVAGLIIAVIALREARQAWRGDSCCAPVVPTATSDCRCGSTCRQQLPFPTTRTDQQA